MKTTVEVLKNKSYYLPNKIDKFIELIQNAKNTAEEQGLVDITVDVESYEEYGSTYAQLTVSGEREETEQETYARENEDALRRKANMEWHRKAIAELEKE